MAHTAKTDHGPVDTPSSNQPLTVEQQKQHDQCEKWKGNILTQGKEEWNLCTEREIQFYMYLKLDKICRNRKEI
jgi:hypothetical protein